MKNLLEKIHNWLVHEEELIKESLHKHLFRKWFVPHSINGYKPYATHHHTLALVVAIIFSFKLIVLGTVIPTESSFAGGISSEELIGLTNQARVENHLGVLKTSEDLNKAALLKAKDMFEKQYWSHNAPEGTTPWHWFEEVSYPYEHAGENLAMDFHSSSGVFDGWRNSRTHWENIMNGNFREIGIAVLPGVFEGRQTTIVVQMFGARPDKEIPAELQKEENIKLQKPTISDPQHGVYINVPNPEIKGRADSSVSVYILDDSKGIGKVKTDDSGHYIYRPLVLEDGVHRLQTYSKTKSEVKSDYSDTVEIIVDTVSPVIKEDSLDVKYESLFGKDIFEIKLEIEEEPNEVQIIAHDIQKELKNTEKNIWSTDLVLDQDLNKENYNVSIYAVDKAYNSAVLNFVLKPTHETEKMVLGVQTTKTNDVEMAAPFVEDLGTSRDLSQNPNNKIQISNKLEIPNDSKVEGVEELGHDLTVQNSSVKEVSNEKSDEYKEVQAWTQYIKIGTLILCSLFFFAYLLQAYVVYVKGVKEENIHPVFHAVSILCIMLLVLIL
jgi:uncharacterized protein YkwD